MTKDIETPALLRAGISWPAVSGGAFVAAAVSIMLISLGAGFGFSAVSPEAGNNPSAFTFTVWAAIWLIVVQWISSFFGGYLAGRLRAPLLSAHSREVMFRDTAGGFVAWAVAVVFTAAIIGSGAFSLAGSAGKASGHIAAAAVSKNTDMPSGYMLDALFRPAQPDNVTGNASEGKNPAPEAARILATAATGSISPQDRDYLTKLVAARTGTSAEDAGQRVDRAIAMENEAISKAKHAAELARKAAASLAFYTFFSMLVGAFIACVAGAIGGRQRDALQRTEAEF
ncbi:hypothetical protein GOB93_06295 [Acetobacter musti]|uniref:Transmembrane protein n=1 Tax=Acetobacter musti TaxID=864732 RepID=A0ABX0JMM9_9PROT|nr:hypothetical protein [Acetobacter musti]NHN84255.1 hypothetical protein [Acetobacter musti]